MMTVAAAVGVPGTTATTPPQQFASQRRQWWHKKQLSRHVSHATTPRAFHTAAVSLGVFPRTSSTTLVCHATPAADEHGAGGEKKKPAGGEATGAGAEVRVADEPNPDEDMPDTVPYVSRDEEERDENDIPTDTAAIASEDKDEDVMVAKITPPPPEPYMGDVKPVAGVRAPSPLSCPSLHAVLSFSPGV